VTGSRLRRDDAAVCLYATSAQRRFSVTALNHY
jgi:hypothetical protein